MAEPLNPTATKTFGRKNWIWIPTWAGYDASTGPTVAELTSASGLDITNILFASGAPQPAQSTNRVSQERRWGATSTAEFIGETTHTGGEMTYALASQAAPAADGVKLWDLIPEGTTGFIVRRLGVARAITPTTTHRVTGWKIENGPSLEVEIGDGEAAEAGAMCTFAVLAKPVQRVLVAA